MSPRWDPEETVKERRSKKEEDHRFIAGRKADKSMWCDICQSKDTTLKIDRDPLTQKLRGLLCTNCAVGLAGFKDNHSYLVLAAQYLRRSESYRDILCQECPCPSKDAELMIVFHNPYLGLAANKKIQERVMCECKCHKEKE